MANTSGWAWDHAKAVADRCAARFNNNAEIDKYLRNIGWDEPTIKRMLEYIDRKKHNEEKEKGKR